MSEELILQFLLNLMPDLVVVISIITIAVKLLKNFNFLKSEIQQHTEFKELQNQFKIVINENYVLKRQLQKVIAKIDRLKEPTTNDSENKEL